MTQQAATNQPDTTSSTKHPRPRASPRTRLANKTAKPASDASTPFPNPAPPTTTKLADTNVVVSQRDASGKSSNKQAVLIGLMKRSEGASLSEMMSLSGWQAHSVRGWISGSLRKKLGLVVTRFKSASGDTCYRIQPKQVVS